jgi:hypothetical protein
VVKLALALAVAVLSGCTLFDADPPDDRCTKHEECFRAQGEVCNFETRRCEPGTVDAGIDAAVDAP